MDPKYIQLLRKCPFDFSRLVGMTGQLEEATGKELTGILLLALQHGRLSQFKDLWSCRPVYVTNAASEERRVASSGSQCCGLPLDKGKSNASLLSSSEETRLQDLTPSTSSFKDPISPPHRIARMPTCLPQQSHQEGTPEFLYYRISFAGIDLPFLGIGYNRPTTTKNKICCYGGSWEGERCFLSSWK